MRDYLKQQAGGASTGATRIVVHSLDAFRNKQTNATEKLVLTLGCGKRRAMVSLDSDGNDEARLVTFVSQLRNTLEDLQNE